MSWSRATTSIFRESTSGRAIARGTGVTSPTQWLDSFGEHVDREEHTSGESGHGREAVHHARVGRDVRSTDVVGAVDRFLGLHRPDQVVEHVAHGDRLRAGLDPARVTMTGSRSVR